MGKSGIVCRKIAATLASTGTPAFFLHPAEAVHGDLGVIQADDVVIAMSYSGETEELTRVLETLKRIGAPLIALTGDVTSTLAQAANVALDCSVSEEACPMNLVPTASTTAALAMGDALAMTVLVEKGFKPEDFAKLHPGGELGKRLMRVEQLMNAGDVPVVPLHTAMRDVIYEMSRKRLGMTSRGRRGRRAWPASSPTATSAGRWRRPRTFSISVARDVMTMNPVTIPHTTLAVEALALMEQRKITSIVVVDADRRVEGVVHLHDLWRPGWLAPGRHTMP